eukprot:c18950_g1_i3.p1 GENE.c18950_g1_i3~~c18950_g1_i3.p1  ORF type:complete len:930 (+),score=233.88 c18950_g1_i3:778-3567(+)
MMTESPMPFRQAAPGSKPEVPEMELEEPEVQPDFVVSKGLPTREAEELLRQWGRNELVDKSEPKWLMFLKQFYQPMPCMIWLAAGVEAAIENWPDMGILLGIQFTNATIAFYESNKAGNAIAALKASLRPEATVKRDGAWKTIDAREIVPGDLVLLASGSAIPADCRVNEGQIEVDQAALTGESLPVTMFAKDSCKMGSTVVRGEVEATVEFTGANTFFGKTASLLKNTHEFTNLQKILMTIMGVLMVFSLVFSGIVFGYLLGHGETVKGALSFTVVLIVASIPIAIEIVVTTTLALGSKELSRHGAIVARLAAIEDLAAMSILCSDKTGTLTMNKMVIQEETPVYVQGENQYSILRYAAMAAKWKEPPRDALDTMVLGQADLDSLDNCKQLSYMPFDPIHKRTEGAIEETLKDGRKVQFKISKGAPHIIAGLCDNEAIHKQCEADVKDYGLRGIRALAVAKTNDQDKWELLGLLTFLDPPRPDTKDTIDNARKYGVDVKMITGDHLLIAKEMARRLGLGDHIQSAKHLPMLDEDQNKPKDLGAKYGRDILNSDGFAQVFPEHKYLIVEALRELNFKVGMTGDGVNDAPALKRADVGIAVHGATDAARAAADIVLTQPGLSTIIHGIVISRGIFKRMMTFLTYRIAATLQLLLFFFIAVLAFPPKDFQPDPKPQDWGDQKDWPDYFHIPVLMLMLITLLNDGTLITIGYDNVRPKSSPERWNLPVLFAVSSMLAAVALLSSLLLLWAGLTSWDENGAFKKLGLYPLTFAEISSMMYLKISISDFLTLFSSRSYGSFFWKTRPSSKVLIGCAIALSASTIIANVWPNTVTDGVPTIGLARGHTGTMSIAVWLYSIFWWFIQDACKVALYQYLKKTNTFGAHHSRKTMKRDGQVSYQSDDEDDHHRQANAPLTRVVVTTVTPETEKRKPQL